MSSATIIPVILSGGSGTRLWPLSRSLFPKQFLNLVSERSLIQETLLRVGHSELFEAPIVVGAEAHRFMLAEQMLEIGVAPRRLIVEPVARNTAAAAAAAAFALAETAPDTLMMVLPADHVIKERKPWLQAVTAGIAAARQGRLVTFGIRPEHPETGYGYIRRGPALDGADGAFCIRSFVEKPTAEHAAQMIAAGDYDWNSGMFLFSAGAYLDELQRFEPDIHAAMRQAIAEARHEQDFLWPARQAYERSPNLSLDHAVMERTDKGAVIPVSCGWSDVGSWSSLWEIGDKDEDGNVTLGDVILDDTQNSYIRANSHLVAAVGIEDCVVIATDDAILVARKDKVQAIRHVVDRLRRSGRGEGDSHRRVHRPWGYYQSIDAGPRFQVKQLMLKPGAQISLQLHYHRAEHWVVVEGTARIISGDKTLLLHENESTFIPVGTRHRLENPGKLPLRIIEVQSGGYLGEDDIVRFDDDYGRS